MPNRSSKVAPGPAEIPAPFHESYGALLAGLPSSVVKKVTARAEARGLDLAVPADYIVEELLEAARGSYERKKQGSKVSAAKRRASKKALAAAPEAALEVEPPAPEAAVEVEPPANH